MSAHRPWRRASLVKAALFCFLFAATAGPAHALLLSCNQTDAPSNLPAETITLRVDLTTGRVEQLNPSGQAYTNRIATNARISSNAIVWSANLMDTGLAKPVPMKWEGTVDRLSGAAWTKMTRDHFVHVVNFTCREGKALF